MIIRAKTVTEMRSLCSRTKKGDRSFQLSTQSSRMPSQVQGKPPSAILKALQWKHRYP
jgi:hypothetical protein